MKRATLSFIFAAVICSAAPPQRQKLSKELQNADSDANMRVIVQWNGGADDANDQKVLTRGGSVQHRFKALKGGVYNLTASQARDLANDPNVAFITPDRLVHSKLDNTAAAINAATAWNAGFTGSGVGVAVIDSGMNQDPNLGGRKNGLVYSLDFTNPNVASIASSYLANASGPLPASTPLPSFGPAPDAYGHGQHIAGIIASNGSSSSCKNCTRAFKGIAPGVNLIDFKVLDQNGSGSDSNVITAIDTAIFLKNVLNIRVINLSLGGPVYESYTQDPVCQAVEAAWKAGITVVVAAGNEGRDNSYGEQGYGTINSPGNDPYVITVGAMKTEGTYTRTDDLVASYSSKGPTQVDHIVKPDIIAPGNLIVSLLVPGSTLQSEYPANAVQLSYYQTMPPAPPAPKGPAGGPAPAAPPAPVSNNYFILNGTSMATGVVTGAVADLLQANPSLTPDQVKLLLMQSAYKTFPTSSTVSDATGTYVDYYDIFTVGAGYLDMAAALANINNVPAGYTAMSPVANYDSTSGNVTVAFDPSSLWGAQAAWGASGPSGSQAAWGASGSSASQAAWGARAAWGASAVWGASVLSGSQAMFGAQAAWGASSSSASQAAWGASSSSASQAAWGAGAIWSSQAAWGADSTSSSQAAWGASSSSASQAAWGASSSQAASIEITGEQ